MKTLSILLVGLASLQLFADDTSECYVRNNPNLSSAEVRGRQERCLARIAAGPVEEDDSHIDTASFNELKIKLRQDDFNCSTGAASAISTIMSGGSCGSAAYFRKTSSRNGHDRYICSIGSINVLILSEPATDDVKRVIMDGESSGRHRVIADCAE